MPYFYWLNTLLCPVTVTTGRLTKAGDRRNFQFCFPLFWFSLPLSYFIPSQNTQLSNSSSFGASFISPLQTVALRHFEYYLPYVSLVNDVTEYGSILYEGRKLEIELPLMELSIPRQQLFYFLHQLARSIFRLKKAAHEVVHRSNDVK